jgi:hypothetical protein
MESFQEDLKAHKKHLKSNKISLDLNLPEKKRKISMPYKNNSIDSKYWDTRLSLNKKILLIKKNKKSNKEINDTQVKLNRSKLLKSSYVKNDIKNFVRPKSAASKSFANYFDLTQKVSDFKRHSNPSVIEKILKNSLKKAKSKKIREQTENKILKLAKEIKKNEIEYQNKQIRLNNSRNSKKYRKLRLSFNHDTSNMYTLKTDASSKSKKRSNCLENIKINKRSSSAEDYYRLKTFDSNTLGKIHKKYNINQKNISLIEKPIKNEYIDSKSRKDSLSSLESSFGIIEEKKIKEKPNVNRTISFINEKNDDESFEKENSLIERFTSSEFLENLADYNKTQDLKSYKTGKVILAPSVMNESNKSSILSIITSQIINCIPKPRPNDFVIESQHEIMYFPRPKYLRAETIHGNSVLIYPMQKPVLEISNTYSNTISPYNTSDKKFTIDHYSLGVHRPGPALASQVENLLSWSLAQNFVIEQLKRHELSYVPDLPVPSQTQFKLTNTIEKKYSTLISYLNNVTEATCNQVFENFSIEKHSVFLKQTQEKKQALYSILLESSENSLSSSSRRQNLCNLYEAPNESASGSSDEDNRRSSISHSRSLTSLHESNSIKSKPAAPLQAAPLHFFGFQQEKKTEKLPVSPQNSPPTSLSPKVESKKKIPENFISEKERSKEFIIKTIGKIKMNELITELLKPLKKNPLLELDKLQDFQTGTPSETEIYDFPDIINISSLLESEITEKTDNLKLKIEINYKKMLLDVLNYLLQQFRPYGYKAEPLPWDLGNFYIDKKVTAEEITLKVLSDLDNLYENQIKTYDNVLTSNQKIDEHKSLKYKEMQLDRIIYIEMRSNDIKWTDYQFEEAQVKLDIADMILYDLAQEIININM